MAPDKYQNNETYQEVVAILGLMHAALPASVSLDDFDAASALPYKVAVSRECLLRRASELGTTALALLTGDGPLSALILLSSLVETTAMLFVFRERLQTVVDRGIALETDTDQLAGMVFARYMPPFRFSPADVERILAAISAKYQPFAEIHRRLADYVHPSWAGTEGMYSRVDTATSVTAFGRQHEHSFTEGIAYLYLCVKVCFDEYQQTASLFDSYIKVCNQSAGHEAG